MDQNKGLSISDKEIGENFLGDIPETQDLQEILNGMSDARIKRMQEIDSKEKGDELALKSEFDAEYAKLEEAIQYIKKSEVIEALKSSRQAMLSQLDEITKKQEKSIQDFESRLNDIKSEAEKAKSSTDSDYIRSIAGSYRDVHTKCIKEELISKLNGIDELRKDEQKKHQKVLSENKKYIDEYRSKQQELRSKSDDEYVELCNSRKGDKTFNELKYIIPDEKREEMSKMIVENGFIPESYMKQFVKTSEQAIAKNKKDNCLDENGKSLLEELYAQYNPGIEKLNAQIKECEDNFKIFDSDSESARISCNSELEKLNNSISTTLKKYGINDIEGAKRVEKKESSRRMFKVKEKKIEFSEKVPEKNENIFVRTVKAVKKSSFVTSITKKISEYKQKREDKKVAEFRKIEQQKQKDMDDKAVRLNNFKEKLAEMTTDGSDSTYKAEPINVQSRDEI